MTTAAASSGDCVYDHGERLAALILDLVDGFLLVADRAASVAYASSNLPKYLGCTVEQVRHRPLASLLHTDDRGLLQPYLERLNGAVQKPALPNRLRFRMEVNTAAVTCVDAIVKLQQFPFSEDVHEPALVCVCRTASPDSALKHEDSPSSAPVLQPIPAASSTLAAKSTAAGQQQQPQQAETLVCELKIADTQVLRSFCSPQLTANWGILAEFFLGKQWCQLVAQSDRPIWQKHLDTAVSSTDRPASSIYRCQVAPGRVAFVKTTSRISGPGLLRSTHGIVGECAGDQGAQRPRIPPARTASDSVLLDLLNSGPGSASGNGLGPGPTKRGAPIPDSGSTSSSLGTPDSGGPPPAKVGALSSPTLPPRPQSQLPPPSVLPSKAQAPGPAFSLSSYQPSGGFAAQMRELTVPPNVRLSPPELPQDVVDTILAMEDQRATTRQFVGSSGGSRVGTRSQEEASAAAAAPSRAPSGLLEKLLSAS